ncbi:hypothetical protein WJX79_000268 [Trebouxia sp. C0005]
MGSSVTFPLTSGAAACAATAFYKSNRKVCEDWFTRMRMLLLRTSAASNSPHLTLHHAFARLADLKAQLRHLQAAAAAPSPVSDASAQRGQSRVLQVKRQKPGQATPVQPTPKVLPLTKAPSGKVVVATPAPTPGKIKLMARPQSAAEGTSATLQPGSEGRADSTSKQHLTPSHARTARAQAARRLSSELQEVLRHAAVAILRIADADAVAGLHQYCQRNFSALPRLVHPANDEKAAAESRVGMERPSSDSSKPGADGQQFDWLYGVSLQASARHEEAAVVYTRFLQQPDKADTCGCKGQAFLVDRCCEAYASVADWEGLQHWLQDLKGQQVPIDRDTSHWPLAPAQEHKYDALAAFDAGQLQEAQHAFDLSVWSDLKGDRGGVRAAEAAEATSLKALMQLHAHSSAKQRPGRDKRLIRTLLQDSKDTLLQSLIWPFGDGLPHEANLNHWPLLSGDDTGAFQALISGTRAIPVLVWRAVVPQLFAILSHEDTGVWGWAQDLLQRLEQLDPAAVLYPALVESKRISKGQATAKPGMQGLLDSCRARQPQLVEQMATVMTELEHMSVLWVEQWHIALLELQAEVGKRVASLQEELKHVNAQADLDMSKQLQIMRYRYAIILAPAIHMIRQRLSLNTADDAQTPLQEQFVSKHLPALKQAAAAFAHPSDDVLMHPELAWNTLKGVSRAIAQQLSAREVQLTALSPVLMHVMSTKTRPKRIAMLGSDGRTYTFLLKGWEDLRLDERLMQLVRTFSVTLRSDPDTARRQLLPCPLSVTPLGASMGLIQWVDHTMPLYGVYKAWQHRQLTDQADIAKSQAAAAGQPPGKAVTIHPPRATDAFYAKLLPALEAAGLPRTTPRKDWPLPLLKQILTESVQETPGHLLTRELWCGCGSASEWWSYQAGYTSSTAAMSMVGHLLGLGDRHLDNILLDKHTGRVVHIDYNIVFDKGQQLRVPEIVPFRLTHTLQAALGATDVEGAFRRGCEHVMRVARRHSTTLSSLLQSILLDPLVTWSPDRDQAGTKKDADAAVALNLFYARSTEQKASCSEVLLALARALPSAKAALQAYAAVHTVADQTASTARAAHREVLEAQEAQAAVASSTEAVTIGLHQAQASIPQLVKELHSNRQLLQRHLRECQGWADRHQYTVKALRDQVPAELMYPNSHWAADQAPVQLGLVSGLGAATIPSIVQAALQCSQRQITLPPMLLHQAHSIDQQATQLLAQRGQGILAGLAGLQAYSAALRLVLTPDYSDSSHHSRWAQAVDSAIASSCTEAMLKSLQLAPQLSNPQDILLVMSQRALMASSSESQHVGLIEALHAEVADTEAAFAQLQQESSGHADLLASHSDQMTVLQSQLDDDISQSASPAVAQLEQLNSAWEQREATAASLRERAEALNAHQASLASQAKLLPSLMHHLRLSSASAVATARQGGQDLPNGVGDHLLQGLSDLAMEESSGSAGLTSSHGAFAHMGPGASAPELVPFSDFDTSVEGADQMLAHALEDDPLEQRSDPTDAGLEPEQDISHVLDFSMMAPPDLVPFSDFDTALAGADQSLELADDSLDSNSSPDLAHVPTQHERSSQAEQLSLVMQDFVHCAGELATAEQQQAGVAAALSVVQLSSESWEMNEQLVAFEWVLEAELEAALQPLGGLGQPALIAPKDPLSEPNWSLSIRRSQVVNALQSALCILSDAEEAWLAWRHASSQTEIQLRRLFRTGQQQHNVHEQFLTSRQQWLSGCDDIAGWIERMAQNVLQLERSREGIVWSRSAGADDKSFAECSALLQQRQFTCSALQSAEQEVKVAQQTLPELRAQAAAAAAKLQPAQMQERQLGQSFAQQAPKLLQVAQAVVQPVRDCQKAAREAPSAVEQTQAALKEVLGHLEGSNRAKAIMASMQEAHDQLTPFQQHASALDESLGAVIEAVEHNLHANSQQQPPQSLQGKPTKGFSKSKRAALVLDAMTPLLPAAMDQVQSPDMTDLSVKQLASAVAALPEQAKAVATSIQQAYQAQAAETADKLFGKASREHRSLNVEQHVDQLIKQATSLDNLCQMYEGWTAWI